MSITTIIGPMFSGKTSELIRLIDRKRIAGKKCLIIKHTQDTRFDNDITDQCCRDNSLCSKHVTTYSEIKYHKCDIDYLSEVNNHRAAIYIKYGYQVIGIEEGFFFSGITEFCNELANNGIEIIVATLESSYKQELFPEIGSLIANSEYVIKLTAICIRCKDREASFNIRIVDSDKEILVGGMDMYQCVCRKCLLEFQHRHHHN